MRVQAIAYFIPNQFNNKLYIFYRFTWL